MTVPTSIERIITHVKPVTEPVVESDEQQASQEVAMTAIKKIKMMLKKPLEIRELSEKPNLSKIDKINTGPNRSHT